MIEPLQVRLIIPKSIEAILFLIVVIKLYRKFPNAPFQQRPQLNKLFIVGLFSWFIYITLDTVIFIIAPLSFEGPIENGKFVGYLIQYPSLFIANIIRDIGFLGLIIISWCYFIAAFSIKLGEKKTNKIFFENKSVLGLMIAFTVMFDIGDLIKVEFKDGQTNTSAAWEGISGLFLVIVIAMFFVSAIMLNTNLKSTVTTDIDEKYRRKIRFLMFGVIAMVAGDIYWLILGLLRKWPAFIDFVMTYMNYGILYWIGHLIWMLSPIFIYLGLREEKKEEI